MSALQEAPELDDDGLEDDPTFVVPAEGWDDVQIDRVLARLSALRREVDEVNRIANARRNDIDEWRDVRQAILAGAIDHRLAFLQAWHEHALAEDPNRKSISLPSGTLKSRASAERIEVVDQAEFVEWARVNATELVREKVTHEPEKKKLPNSLRVAQTNGGPVVIDSATGEPVPGVAWRPASRTFSVETPQPEVA